MMTVSMLCAIETQAEQCNAELQGHCPRCSGTVWTLVTDLRSSGKLGPAVRTVSCLSDPVHAWPPGSMPGVHQ